MSFLKADFWLKTMLIETSRVLFYPATLEAPISTAHTISA